MLLLPTLSAALIATQAPLVTPLPRVPLPRPSANATRAAVHSNHTSAGTRGNGSLTIALDVVESAWKPEGDDDPEVPILAFAEHDQSPLERWRIRSWIDGSSIPATCRSISKCPMQ